MIRAIFVIGFAVLAISVAANGVGGRLASVGSISEVGSSERLVPRTLVSLPMPVYGFAQDGRWIAYASGSGGCVSVTIRALTSGRDYRLNDQNCDLDFRELALARARALWTRTWSGNFFYVDLYDGAAGGSAEFIGEYGLTGCYGGEEGSYIPAIAGDEPTLVYSYARIEPRDDSLQECQGTPLSKTGGVFRASGVRIAHIPPAVVLAVTGNRIAVAPLDPSTKSGGFHPAINGPVQIYTTRGRLVATFSPPGRVLALALSKSIVVALSKTLSGKRLEWHKASNGAFLGSRHVGSIIAPSLSAAGTTVVYRAGVGIWKLDAQTGKATALASATSQPIGLSIDGSRVAWAENINGHGRIRALELPSRGR